MHSWYLQENISSKAHKHILRGHHNQKDSEPENQGAFSTHTLYIISIIVTQSAFSKHTLYNNSVTL